jgi:hypothetical protein
MRFRFALLAVVFITSVTPTPARAEGYVAPGISVAFGNPSARGLADFVVDLGWLSPEPIGVEIDTTYAPSFFGRGNAYGGNSVTTAMGNVVLSTNVTGRRRGYHESYVRPYLSGGLGLIREETSAPAITHDDLGANFGLGIMALGSGHVGVRADLRYFRDLQGSSNGNTTSIDFGAFHFWRAGISVMFGF